MSLAARATPLPQFAPRLLLTPTAVLRNRPDIQRAERQLAAERERTAQGLAQADREAIVVLTVHRQRQGLASAPEVIATQLAVLAGRGDLQHSEARVTAATIAVLKALGAGIRHDTAAPVAVSMLKRDAQESP